MIKHIIILVITCFSLVPGLAQDVEFIESSYDFGEVEEVGGPIEHTFLFVNKATQSIRIEQVNASCGCTTPGWTMEEVMPGDTGMVKAQFDPLNRPGKFEKSLSVVYTAGNGEEATAELNIEGMVKPKPRSVEDEMPVLLGSIRFKYKSLNMGKMTTEGLVKEEFDVFNAGDSPVVWLQDKGELPDHVAVSYKPDTLMPDEMGEIEITYDPIKRNDLGFVNDQILLMTNENNQPEKELNLIATIEEYFPPMSKEELDQAPRLVFDKTQHDYGQVRLGNTVVTSFQLTNTGKKDLLIRKLKPNCSCTTGKLSGDRVKPGQSVSMEVSFDTTGRKGRQYKTVTVFSNDPTASTQMITVKAEIID